MSDVGVVSVPEPAALNAELHVLHAAAAPVSKLLRRGPPHLHVVLDELLGKKQDTAKVIGLGLLAGVELSTEHATRRLPVDAGRFMAEQMV